MKIAVVQAIQSNRTAWFFPVAISALFGIAEPSYGIDASDPGDRRKCIWDLKGRWDITSAKGSPTTLQVLEWNPVGSRMLLLKGIARNAQNDSGRVWIQVDLKSDGLYPNPNSRYQTRVYIDWFRPGPGTDKPKLTGLEADSSYNDSYDGAVEIDGSLAGGTAFADKPNQLGIWYPEPIGPWRRAGTFRCVTAATIDDAVARAPDSSGLASSAIEPFGAIGEKYVGLGGARGALGAPGSSEADAPHGGRCQQFQNGMMCWHPEIGEAFGVWGAIYSKWLDMGRTEFGYPITDERVTSDGRGRYNHFRGMQYPNRPEASIFWSPQTGAHAIYGAIRDAWAQQGWERGPLGYPTSGEHQDGKYRRVNFQGGYIRWAPDTGIETGR